MVYVCKDNIIYNQSIHSSHFIKKKERIQNDKKNTRIYTMLEVFFAATPNGWKVSIALEELKAAGCDIDWKVVNVNLATDMFTDWYMEVSPNSKMPAIRDDGFTMFESGAILHYLADKFPGVLLPKDPHKKWTALSWLHWQMANVGPMFGNRLTYIRYLPEAGEVHPHPQERFGKEARRLAEVLDRQLEGQDYICGEFSIVDISVYPWLRGWKWSKVDLTGERLGNGTKRLDNVLKWIDRVRAREGVSNGLRWGFEGKEDEIDKWSEERRNSYKKSGGNIAVTHGVDKTPKL